MKSEGAAQVLYLYGITEEGRGSVPGVAGVDGSATVEALPCSGLTGWISRVDKKEFADTLAANMENLEWLAEVSVRHQHVVAAIAASRDILPARFGTVFRSPSSLASHINKDRALLERDLKRIKGCEEWGLKIFSSQGKPQAGKGAKSGRDYLRAKAVALHTETRAEAEPEVRRLLKALDRVAVESAPGSGAVSRSQRGLHWQGSLLVKRSEREHLQELIDRFAQDWTGMRRIELSGPWPPYSFVSRTQETRADSSGSTKRARYGG